MSSVISTSEQANYETFRDCLSDALIQNLRTAVPKPKKKSRPGRTQRKSVDTAANDVVDSSTSNDAEELGEFIEYLAAEIFPALPEEIRTLSYSKLQFNPALSETYTIPLSTSVIEDLTSRLPASALDSLTLYTTCPSPQTFLAAPLTAYVTSSTSAPPIWVTTRCSACEICDRDHVPLTYHHLIPRAIHAKALKRGWTEEWELNKVAWLCRACHSFVHRVASHEELAREFDSVEKLTAREDVRAFATWVSGVRWKSR